MMRIAIIGSGFAGLAAAIRLKQSGVEDFVIFERESQVGGTWRDNHYPGAACDVPSHLYSLSFAQNPNWTRVFAPQSEIFDYTLGLIRQFDLTGHLRLSEGVEHATFDSQRKIWEIDTSMDRYEFDIIVSACGGLSRPMIPEFRGLASFTGPCFHTARWRHDVDLKGKRVAIIGTGASAIQVVPAIAEKVEQLDIYMRTPSWILPRDDKPVPEATRELFKEFPSLLAAKRAAIYARMESHALAFFNPALMRIAKKDCINFLESSVSDPELRAKLTPNYLPGCKRILLSDDFYPALNRLNVDVLTHGIREFTETGIQDDLGGLRPYDVVIMATGFKVAEDIAPFPVVGKFETLQEVWKEKAEAYKGTTVAGFPNFFLLVGPNTALGHNSMIYMIESQVSYVLDGVRKMSEKGWRTVDVRPEFQRIYNDEIQVKLSGSVWESGCVSWYRTRGGVNTTVWPDFTFKFRSITREFDENAYFLESN